jgi:hypothetical protein
MSSVVLCLGTRGRRARLSFRYDAAHCWDVTCLAMRIEVELEVRAATGQKESSEDPATAGRSAEA